MTHTKPKDDKAATDNPMNAARNAQSLLEQMQIKLRSAHERTAPLDEDRAAVSDEELAEAIGLADQGEKMFRSMQELSHEASDYKRRMTRDLFVLVNDTGRLLSAASEVRTNLIGKRAAAERELERREAEREAGAKSVKTGEEEVETKTPPAHAVVVGGGSQEPEVGSLRSENTRIDDGAAFEG